MATGNDLYYGKRVKELGPVEKALRYVDEGMPDIDTEALSQRVAVLERERDQTLPIERDLRQRIDREIAKLEREIADTEEARRSDPDVPYPRIHLKEPLTWRNHDTYSRTAGLPQLVPFRLDQSTVRFRGGQKIDLGGLRWVFGVMALVFALVYGLVAGITGAPMWPLWTSVGALFVAVGGAKVIEVTYNRWVNSISPRFPKVLTEPYDNMLRNRRRGTWTATTFFSGAIPAEVRAEIREAQQVFGDDIFLITEPQGWDVQERPKFQIDPLVIGVRNNLTYLVTSFDLTPIEEVVKAEFTE